jgi:hypothetical protein
MVSVTSNRSSVRGEDPLGCIELIWVLCCPIPSLKIASHRGVHPDDRALLLFRGAIADCRVGHAHGQAVCALGVADPVSDGGPTGRAVGLWNAAAKDHCELGNMTLQCRRTDRAEV